MTATQSYKSVKREIRRSRRLAHGAGFISAQISDIRTSNAVLAFAA